MTTDTSNPTQAPPPGRLAIQITGHESASALATIVSRAFKRALAFDTVLPPGLFERDARSGRKMRMVVANLADAIPGARCLAIGAGDGALACAALSGRADLVCIEAGTTAGTRALFQETLQTTRARAGDSAPDVRVEDAAFETIDVKALGVFNMLILESQHDLPTPRLEAALGCARVAVATDFVLIVDAWSLPAVRASLETGLRPHRLSCLYAIDIRIGLGPDEAPESETTKSETRGNDWGRGYYIAVLRKRPLFIRSVIGWLLALGTRR